MMKVLDYIRNVLILAGKIKLCMLVTKIVLECGKKITEQLKTEQPLTYYEMVGIIADSDMLDSNKQEAIELLKHTNEEEYYRAVYHILKSDMLDSTKLEIIEELSK